MTFATLLTKYRKTAFSTEDLGARFERLIQAYLQTDPKYTALFKKVWLWNEFFAKNDLGGHDTGIDLVCQTFENDFWAVQCKCFQENSYIDKPAVDTFLSTSSRKFPDEHLQTVRFAHRLWISTTNKWTTTANEAIRNQNPPVNRINLYDLQNAPVDWGKLEEGVHGEKAQTAKKTLRPHQTKAVEDAHAYFKENDRGKLIMACGTGKTFTALRIAENEIRKQREKNKQGTQFDSAESQSELGKSQTQGNGLVLFLVPSIALLGQTLNEWYADAQEPFNAICICSDPEVSKNRKKNEDIDTFSVVDLALPASTNVHNIVNQFRALEHKPCNDGGAGMTVVFSTYQSIDVIAKVQEMLGDRVWGIGDRVWGIGDRVWGIGDEAQTPHPAPHTLTPAPHTPYPEFDLIICDEAHRTTGVTLSGEDDSAFVKVHDNDFLRAKKRLYMTATPRLYSDDIKSKAAQADAVLCSMDDEKMYGDEIYRIGFGQAVDEGLLTDYKVLILTLNQNDVPPAVQKMIADKENEINTDDASKLIGCINALSKQVLGDEGSIKSTDPEPMRRAVAFCQTIATSKKITATFNTATEAYMSELPQEKREKTQSVSAQHIDGTMNASQRNELMSWLKANPDEGECRVLTNVRCLSEGVDVPSLDAVMFLSARNSQVDVVQSVGRVMRKAPDKKYGYIIIPVVVPANVEADKALDDNERYKVVWTVLNALRAHDDRFNATVNKIELNRNKPQNILVGRPDISFDEFGNPVYPLNTADSAQTNKDIAQQLALQFEQLQNVVFARMVQKVGDKRYWEQWAKSVAQIAERQIEWIGNMVGYQGMGYGYQGMGYGDQGLEEIPIPHTPSPTPHPPSPTPHPPSPTPHPPSPIKTAFEQFLEGLQININPSITATDAIEMLSQHIITKPVFEALFEGYSFVKNNPISISMQTMLDVLETQAIEKDVETLQKFYDSVKMRASGIDNAEGKQRIIIELYDKFFKAAFPKMVERLGIVYTPVEVVDFIIHSVNDVLKQEFGRTVSNVNVNILDPFTGTGTFITRLIQSGLIERNDLERKYRHELFANEIVLLAYYIAAINIENAYHDAVMGYGVQGMGYGVQGMGYGVQGMGYINDKNINYGNNSNIQGVSRLAGGYESCGNDICGNPEFSERGDLRSDESNTESGSINSCEHRGGLWAKEQSGISVFSVNSQRVANGIGNSFIDSNENKLSEHSDNGNFADSTQLSRPFTDNAQEIPIPQTLTPTPHTPHPIPHTPSPIPYTPFDGICLTDTFQLNENDEQFKGAGFSPENSERIDRQKNSPITVIIGNPPYSIGQKSANDNAQNQSYPKLDAKIANTYAKHSSAGLNKSLYDAYIKAFRWSTDRLGNNDGIIAFVSNGAWLDGNSTDGFRKHLEKEFSSIYVFNLRGNQRTSGELSRKEGGKIFGSGSRTPIAITILVKKKT